MDHDEDEHLMNRRGFLSTAGLAIPASFAGCLSAIDDDGNPQETETLPVRFWLDEVARSASDRDTGDPIVFRNLSPAEQVIVQTTLEEGAYTAERGKESQALDTLRNRIEQRTGGGQTLEAYLRRNDTDYGIGFADGDHIIAHPDR